MVLACADTELVLIGVDGYQSSFFPKPLILVLTSKSLRITVDQE